MKFFILTQNDNRHVFFLGIDSFSINQKSFSMIVSILLSVAMVISSITTLVIVKGVFRLLRGNNTMMKK